MISLRAKPVRKDVEPQIKGFDDFELTLGDVLRGERATQNKTLDDLKRELRIQPSYLLAIEEADPTEFDTPGFIAGYVRSYAKYLGLDPDWAFQKFCQESGFATAHGMSADALPRKRTEEVVVGSGPKDPFADTSLAFVPPAEPFYERVNFKAAGSILVLLMLMGGLGYGAMNVVQKVQQVQIVPIDRAVVVASDLDPLLAGDQQLAQVDDSDIVGAPTVGDLDRIYKTTPSELAPPKFEPRDGPIATLDPAERGLFANRPLSPGLPSIDRSASLAPTLNVETLGEGVVDPSILAAATSEDGVVMFAVREVWARAVAPDGTRVFQGIMQPGQEFAIPQTEVPVRLRSGNSGSLYFRVDGVIYGPAGRGTSTAKRVSLDRADIKEKYSAVETPEDPALIAFLENRKEDQSAFVENQD